MRPERAEHPVGRVAPNRHDLDACPAAQPAGEQLGRREDAPVQLGDLGQVVGHEPHLAADQRVVGEDHDRVAGDAAQLLDPALQLVVPVVDREHGHRGIGAVVAQRQVGRARAEAGGIVGGRCAAMTSLGSTAMTYRSSGS